MADNKQTHAAPEGQLLLRTVAMPRDTNPNQDIFGGWIMSQMDLGGFSWERTSAAKTA